MKIVTILGARPQFIKASMLSKEIKNNKNINEVIIHTGQHFDKLMSDFFFHDMQIPQPKYNLNIHSLSHGSMIGRQIEKIESILLKEKPDYALVYGDTNSTLSGALAASKIHIPIIHIEAGMRSFNKEMPEEINRIITDHLSTFLFATSQYAYCNLIKEGINKNNIYVVGDIMYDAAKHYIVKAEKKSNILLNLKLIRKQYILATIHRQENTDDKDKLETIISILSKSKIPIIIPLHPRTKKKIKEFNINIDEAITLIDPVRYLDMLVLLKNAKKIVTDSGGVQKEAYYFQVPCITLREETEWIELVDKGANIVVGTDSYKINYALNNFNPNIKFSFDKNLNNISNKIIEIIK